MSVRQWLRRIQDNMREIAEREEQERVRSEALDKAMTPRPNPSKVVVNCVFCPCSLKPQTVLYDCDLEGNPVMEPVVALHFVAGENTPDTNAVAWGEFFRLHVENGEAHLEHLITPHERQGEIRFYQSWGWGLPKLGLGPELSIWVCRSCVQSAEWNTERVLQALLDKSSMHRQTISLEGLKVQPTVIPAAS